ncbi:MAG: signal peptidase II [Myxococcales bacterium]|nr:signal peptidase II [Myxococcales bacterium]
MTAKLRVFLTTLCVALPADWASKLWIDRNLSYADRIPVIDGFFYITHVRNPGAAFGMFADSPAPFREIFFIAVTLVAVFLVISFFRNLAPGDRFSALALGLVLAGAIGNLGDRLTRGEVVDFLHFRLFGGYTWPDFNFADSFIVAGVALLVLELLASEGEDRSGEAEPPVSD